jgi:hypothetical protein
MRIKCFTHSDLDGVVSNLLFCKYYNLQGYEHSTENCSTGSDTDLKIKAYLNSSYEYRKDDIIVITDVCMSYEVACILDNLPNIKIHIDHHDTSQKMLGVHNPNGDFSWSYIKEGDSATMMVYKYLNKATKEKKELNIKLKEYQPLVVVTDLWDTKSRVSEDFIKWTVPIENTLSLMNCIGFSNFKARFMINPNIELSEVELARVSTVHKIKNNVMKYTQVYSRPKEYKDFGVIYGVCFGGLYRSEVAEYVFKNNPELLFVAIIDMNGCRVSLRTGHHKLAEGLDLTKVCKQFDENGGGHPFACAFGFSIDEYSKVVNKLMFGEFVLE